MKEKLIGKLKEKRGVNTLEIVLIIVVLLSLILIFRTQILGIMDKVFSQINTSVTGLF